MKKSDLKKLIKPIVDECIQESVQELVYEAVIESGILSEVISEVMRGITLPTLVESRQHVPQQAVPAPVDMPQERHVSRMAQVVAGAEKRSSQAVDNELSVSLREQRSSLEETMTSRLGVNVFEGTEEAVPEASHAANEGQGPLSDVAPSDPGVSLDLLTGGRNYSNHL